MDKFAGGSTIFIVQHLQPDGTPPVGTPMLFFRNVMTFICGGTALLSGVLVCGLWLTKFLRSKTKDNFETINFDEFSPGDVNLIATEAPMAANDETNTVSAAVQGRKKEHRVSFGGRLDEQAMMRCIGLKSIIYLAFDLRSR